MNPGKTVSKDLRNTKSERMRKERSTIRSITERMLLEVQVGNPLTGDIGVGNTIEDTIGIGTIATDAIIRREGLMDIEANILPQVIVDLTLLHLRVVKANAIGKSHSTTTESSTTKTTTSRERKIPDPDLHILTS